MLASRSETDLQKIQMQRLAIGNLMHVNSSVHVPYKQAVQLAMTFLSTFLWSVKWI